MLALNTLREVSSAVLQKMGIGAKVWWWEFRWVSHHSGLRGREGLEPYLPSGEGDVHGGLVISGGLIPHCTLWCCKYFFYFQVICLTCARSSQISFVFMGHRSATSFKERLWHRFFSCEFCEIFKNTFFYRRPLDNCFC